MIRAIDRLADLQGTIKTGASVSRLPQPKLDGTQVNQRRDELGMIRAIGPLKGGQGTLQAGAGVPQLP